MVVINSMFRIWVFVELYWLKVFGLNLWVSVVVNLFRELLIVNIWLK